MHSAIGAELADFLQNKEDAKKTLSDIEDAYRAAAKEKASCNNNYLLIGLNILIIINET